MPVKHILLSLFLLILAGWPDAAGAHKEHAKQRAAQAAQQPKQAPAPMMTHEMSPEVHEAVKEDLARLEAERSQPWAARSVDLIGRLHPMAVHFPLALFPIAWIALILGRRRGDAEPLIRSLIIVAGAAGAIAAALGWINGGFSLVDSDPLLLWHRWIGTVLGIAGAAVALWAWRRSSAAHSRAMIWVLGAFTAVLLAQGWLGGALVHGADHLNW